MESTCKFKKTNLALMVFLSLITVGIYVPIWFMTRKKSFDHLEKHHLNYFMIVVLLIINSVTFLYRFFNTLFLTEYGIAIFDSIETIFTFIGLGLLYFSVFRAKEAIEHEFQEEIYNPWLLFLFHIWYLQYKINRLDWHDEQLNHVVNE